MSPVNHRGLHQGYSKVDTLAKSLKEVLLLTAEEVLGRQKKKIQLWVTNEVLDLCDQRRQLKQQKYIKK